MGHWHTSILQSFNTQPPEGGWLNFRLSKPSIWQFQHTAARGRLERNAAARWSTQRFQHTAARGRLARRPARGFGLVMFQHTAARGRLAGAAFARQKVAVVSTHSRPRAAGS